MSLKAIVDNLSIAELSAKLRSLHAATAQRQAIASVNTSLLLFEDELFNTASGESRHLSGDAERSWPEQIADCASLLLPKSEQSSSILLLLPSSAFIATGFSLGISGEKIIKSSLRLQASTLLPSYERPLLLALNGNKSEGVALWFPQDDADALYSAFANHDLHLTALMPRVLAQDTESDSTSSEALLDEDGEHLTQLVLKDGSLSAWLSVHQCDLKEEAFQLQWQSEQELMTAQNVKVLNRETWSALRSLVTARGAYCFFPAGAIEAGKQRAARRQRSTGMIAAAAVVLILLLPFLTNWAQIVWLNSEVNEYRDLSAQARFSQSEVYRMEETWGALAEFPQQDVAAVLLSLNEEIESSLSSFSLNKGVIDITGYSHDPAFLIEQLAEKEQFYEVGQSRSSSGGRNSELGDRFGIRMKLSGVDFPGYEAAYEENEL